MSTPRFMLAAFKGTPPPPKDPNFNYVAALLHGNGTNGATNNVYTGTTQSILSRTGATAEGSFSPYGGPWSTYFPASISYLLLPASTAFGFGTGAFTIEGWINMSIVNPNVTILVDVRSTATNSGTQLRITTAGQLQFADGPTGNLFTDSTALVNGQWYHVAFTRDGSGVYRLFKNGVQVATATNASDCGSSQNVSISGSYANTTVAGNGVDYGLRGSISNMRIVKGTALYTTGFTPPTGPLTVVAGTSFLGCQSNRHLDVSTNGFSVTATNGTARTQRFTPFGDNGVPYAVSTAGGSAYLDGATGYLSTPVSANFQLTGDFTLEAWVYPIVVGASGVAVFAYWTFGNAPQCGFMFQIGQTGTLTLNYGIGGTTAALNTTIKAQFNTWSHIAVTRQGSTIRFFVNGVMDASTPTLSGALNTAVQPLFVGADNNRSGFTMGDFFNGYLGDSRIVNGTALYTANFTPPSAPMTAVTNTVLLYTAQTAGAVGIFDNAMQQSIVTSGTAQISTAQQKFGAGSLAFDGSLTCVAAAPNSSIPSWGTANFTIECWVYVTSFNSGAGVSNGIFGQRASTAAFAPISVSIVNGVWTLFASINGSAWTVNVTGSAVTTGGWQHLAVVRSGSTLSLYINGVLNTSSTALGSSALVASTAGFAIGGSSTTLAANFNSLIGFIQDFRITYGFARYPTDAFPTTQFGNSITTDPRFNYVTMLVHGNGQNAYSNNVVSATLVRSQLTLTAAGSSLLGEGTFTPFGANWSNLFDGSTGYLSYASGLTGAVGNNNYTAEAWINLNVLPASGQANSFAIIQKGYSGGSNLEWNLYIEQVAGSYFLFSQTTTNGSTVSTSTSSALGAITTGTWYHVAITKVGTTLTFWFNGVNVGTAVVSANMYAGTAPYTIGANTVGAAPLFSGFVSNARVVSGLAVYSSNFTPPTAPLTAISGTVLLVCCASSFADQSSLQASVTVTGASKVSRFNPLGVNNVPYSKTIHGGSCWFGGAGSSLSASANAAFGFGTGQFTLEAWIYPTGFNASSGGIVDLRSALTAQATALTLSATGQLQFFDGPNNVNITDPTPVPLNAWTHAALTRDGFGVWRMFKNGVQVATTTDAANLGTTTQPLLIGQLINGTSFWWSTGFISSIRISPGLARYTQTFTPPAGPFVMDGVTSFLFNATDMATEIFDSAMQQNVLLGSGTVSISTTQQKWGSGAIKFPQSSNADTLQLPSPLVPVWGTVSWTVEGWWYVNSVSANSDGFFGQRASYTNYTPMMVCTNAGKFEFDCSSTGSSWASSVVSTTVVPTNQWFHLAFVRDGSSLYLYLNGSLIASGSTGASLLNNGQPFTIGGSASSLGGGNNALNGYLQDFRITFGKARYPGGTTFTPPAATFPSQ